MGSGRKPKATHHDLTSDLFLYGFVGVPIMGYHNPYISANNSIVYHHLHTHHVQRFNHQSLKRSEK